MSYNATMQVRLETLSYSNRFDRRATMTARSDLVLVAFSDAALAAVLVLSGEQGTLAFLGAERAFLAVAGPMMDSYDGGAFSLSRREPRVFSAG
jgi:hypothetical protein